MHEKLTKAQFWALDLIGSGTVSRVSDLRHARVGQRTINRLSDLKLIEMRFPGSLYITEAGRNARAALTDHGQGEGSDDA